jgi:hypothetical protein
MLRCLQIVVVIAAVGALAHYYLPAASEAVSLVESAAAPIVTPIAAIKGQPAAAAIGKSVGAKTDEDELAKNNLAALRGAAPAAVLAAPVDGDAFTTEGYIVNDPWGNQKPGDGKLRVDKTDVRVWQADWSKCPLSQIKVVNAILTSTDPDDMEVLTILCTGSDKPLVFELDDARAARVEIKKLAGLPETSGESNSYDADTSAGEGAAAEGAAAVASGAVAVPAAVASGAAAVPAAVASGAAAMMAEDTVDVSVVALGGKFDPSGKTKDGQELTLSISKAGVQIMAGAVKVVSLESDAIVRVQAVLGSADPTEMESLVIDGAAGEYGFELEDAREARDIINFYLGKYKQSQAGEYDAAIVPQAKGTYELSAFPIADLDPSHKMPEEAVLLVSVEGVGIQDAAAIAAAGDSDVPAYMIVAAQIKSVKALVTSSDPQDMENLLIDTVGGVFAFEIEDAREARDVIKMTVDLGLYDYKVGYGYDPISPELQ